MLLVADGGSRPACDAIQPRHRKRWDSRLYMDGPSLINFTVDAVPQVDRRDLWQANQLTVTPTFRLYLMHQATWKMLDQLRLSDGCRCGAYSDRAVGRWKHGFVYDPDFD